MVLGGGDPGPALLFHGPRACVILGQGPGITFLPARPLAQSGPSAKVPWLQEA